MPKRRTVSGDDAGSAGARFEAAVKALVADGSAGGIAEAMAVIAREDPKLFAEYITEQQALSKIRRPFAADAAVALDGPSGSGVDDRVGGTGTATTRPDDSADWSRDYPELSDYLTRVRAIASVELDSETDDHRMGTLMVALDNVRRYRPGILRQVLVQLEGAKRLAFRDSMYRELVQQNRERRDQRDRLLTLLRQLDPLAEAFGLDALLRESQSAAQKLEQRSYADLPARRPRAGQPRKYWNDEVRRQLGKLGIRSEDVFALLAGACLVNEADV